MTKDELISKQQIEIEELKVAIELCRQSCSDAGYILCRPEQWSIKCPEFPKVAMQAIIRAREKIQEAL